MGSLLKFIGGCIMRSLLLIGLFVPVVTVVLHLLPLLLPSLAHHRYFGLLQIILLYAGLWGLWTLTKKYLTPKRPSPTKKEGIL